MKTFKNLLTIIGGITVIASAKAIYEKKKERWYLKGKREDVEDIRKMMDDTMTGMESEETEEEPEEKENEEES